MVYTEEVVCSSMARSTESATNTRRSTAYRRRLFVAAWPDLPGLPAHGSPLPLKGPAHWDYAIWIEVEVADGDHCLPYIYPQVVINDICIHYPTYTLNSSLGEPTRRRWIISQLDTCNPVKNVITPPSPLTRLSTTLAADWHDLHLDITWSHVIH